MGEECDDWNEIPGDGCDHLCYLEDPAIVGVCDGCRIINGVGFNPSSNCGCFVSCLFDMGGVNIEHIERSCDTQFWDQDMLTCVPVNQTECISDPCAMDNRDFWPMKFNCRQFWICGGTRTRGHGCCALGQRFDPVADGCVADITCEDICTVEDEAWSCNLLPNGADPTGHTFYQQQVLGNGAIDLIPMTCPDFTAFNHITCVCSDFIIHIPVCTADYVMNFEQFPILDVVNDAYIVNQGVQVDNALDFGIFSETTGTKLIIPRYANMEWGDEWAIRVVFNGELHINVDAPLFSNSGCMFGTSIDIYLDDTALEHFVRVTVETEDGIFNLEADFTVNAVNNVFLQYKAGLLNLVVTNSDMSVLIDSDMVAASGLVIRRHCAVQWGFGYPDRHFTGNIYLGEVWLCVPDDFLPTP